jgi:threonine aldolase
MRIAIVPSLIAPVSSATCFGGAEIAALSEVCRARGLKLHMDGARFANALVRTGATPADLSWKAGVDILSFGATKNGALAAEAIVCFDKVATASLPHLRKRAGHLFSKHRYLAAQMVGYLEDGLWLDCARRANAMAAALAETLRGAGAQILHPVDANMIFARIAPSHAQALRDSGAVFHPWPSDGEGAYRFVMSWATTAEEIAVVRRALSAL